MLPPHEMETLIRTLAAAVDRAGEGKLAEGYAALRAGLARALEIRSQGERGDDERVARWCWACEWFSGRYGVARGSGRGDPRGVQRAPPSRFASILPLFQGVCPVKCGAEGE